MTLSSYIMVYLTKISSHLGGTLTKNHCRENKYHLPFSQQCGTPWHLSGCLELVVLHITRPPMFSLGQVLTPWERRLINRSLTVLLPTALPPLCLSATDAPFSSKLLGSLAMSKELFLYQGHQSKMINPLGWIVTLFIHPFLFSF